MPLATSILHSVPPRSNDDTVAPKRLTNPESPLGKLGNGMHHAMRASAKPTLRSVATIETQAL